MWREYSIISDMKSEISANDLLKFEQTYCSNPENSVLENSIQQAGLLATSRNPQKYKFKFNIEVPKTKIYHQHDSHQCNIYAFLRVVKDILRQRSELNINNLDLSSNYINFYDKLEKANALYNDLIDTDELSLEVIRDKVDWYIASFGTFHFCREIVNKYGLVPTQNMKEVGRNYNDKLVIKLLRDKIKSDAVALLKMSSQVEKLAKKSTLMYGVYQFLAKVYGMPPATFNFHGEDFTPLEFKNHFLGEALEDFVTITAFDKETLLSSYAFVPNIYLNDSETILYSDITKIKEAIVKQLISGVSVWFSAGEFLSSNYTEGVLDDRAYDFAKVLDIPAVGSTKKLALDIVSYDHAMCITGALTKNNVAEQFRVDNSFGRFGKYDGQMLMTKSFLENSVITLVVDRKFLV